MAKLKTKEMISFGWRLRYVVFLCRSKFVAIWVEPPWNRQWNSGRLTTGVFSFSFVRTRLLSRQLEQRPHSVEFMVVSWNVHDYNSRSVYCHTIHVNEIRSRTIAHSTKQQQKKTGKNKTRELWMKRIARKWKDNLPFCFSVCAISTIHRIEMNMQFRKLKRETISRKSQFIHSWF